MDDDQVISDLGEARESAPRSSRRSARAQRIEVITRGERRRWSIEQKRQIVAESLAAGATSSEVIRKYGITSGQLYTWRQQVATRVDGDLSRPAANFARVNVVAALPQPEKSKPTDDSAALRHVPPPLSDTSHVEGLIEIVLPSGVLVRVNAHIDTRALRRVLGVLDER